MSDAAGLSSFQGVWSLTYTNGSADRGEREEAQLTAKDQENIPHVFKKRFCQVPPLLATVPRNPDGPRQIHRFPCTSNGFLRVWTL